LTLLREGLELRWVPPRTVLERVLAQIDGELPADVDKSPFFEPFTRLAKDIPSVEQEALRAQARRAIAESVVPALRKLRAFVADEYLPAALGDGALSNYPNGTAVYAARVRSNITTDLSPAQIHAIGLRELSCIRGEMEPVMKQVKFDGDFAAFVHYLNTDPKRFYTSPEALLAGYRDMAKRIDPELPKLFAELPRAPYGVRAMPPHMNSDSAEYYSGPALDGSKPGWFNANAQAYQKRPTWAMETLVAHEAVPGHHLQNARAMELGELPKFRRSGGFTVYGEGWALYAEPLRPRPVQRPVQPFWPPAGAGTPSCAAGGGHRPAQSGLEPSGSDRLHDRAYWPRALLCGRRGRSLYLMAGPGTGLNDRAIEDHRVARPREGGSPRALRHPPLPLGRARPGRSAVAGAGAGRGCVDRYRRQRGLVASVTRFVANGRLRRRGVRLCRVN
jgi:hypothetical protein